MLNSKTFHFLYPYPSSLFNFIFSMYHKVTPQVNELGNAPHVCGFQGGVLPELRTQEQKKKVRYVRSGFFFKPKF